MQCISFQQTQDMDTSDNSGVQNTCQFRLSPFTHTNEELEYMQVEYSAHLRGHTKDFDGMDVDVEMIKVS